MRVKIFSGEFEKFSGGEGLRNFRGGGLKIFLGVVEIFFGGWGLRKFWGGVEKYFSVRGGGGG